MYSKRQRINRGSYGLTSNPFCKESRVYRSPSFYIRGGVDLSGKDNRKPLPSACDDPDHPGEVNMLTDATVDRLELLDYATNLDHIADLKAVETATGDHVEKPE